MTNKKNIADQATNDFDAVVVGAGFAGLYMLHLLRDKLGLHATAIEAGDGVGGTWYTPVNTALCDLCGFTM